jgi:hypothetical protein
MAIFAITFRIHEDATRRVPSKDHFTVLCMTAGSLGKRVDRKNVQA